MKPLYRKNYLLRCFNRFYRKFDDIIFSKKILEYINKETIFKKDYKAKDGYDCEFYGRIRYITEPHRANVGMQFITDDPHNRAIDYALRKLINPSKPQKSTNIENNNHNIIPYIHEVEDENDEVKENDEVNVLSNNFENMSIDSEKNDNNNNNNDIDKTDNLDDLLNEFNPDHDKELDVPQLENQYLVTFLFTQKNKNSQNEISQTFKNIHNFKCPSQFNVHSLNILNFHKVITCPTMFSITYKGTNQEEYKIIYFYYSKKKDDKEMEYDNYLYIFALIYDTQIYFYSPTFYKLIKDDDKNYEPFLKLAQNFDESKIKDILFIIFENEEYFNLKDEDKIENIKGLQEISDPRKVYVSSENNYKYVFYNIMVKHYKEKYRQIHLNSFKEQLKVVLPKLIPIMVLQEYANKYLDKGITNKTLPDNLLSPVNIDEVEEFMDQLEHYDVLTSEIQNILYFPNIMINFCDQIFERLCELGINEKHKTRTIEDTNKLIHMMQNMNITTRKKR